MYNGVQKGHVCVCVCVSVCVKRKSGREKARATAETRHGLNASLRRPLSLAQSQRPRRTKDGAHLARVEKRRGLVQRARALEAVVVHPLGHGEVVARKGRLDRRLRGRRPREAAREKQAQEEKGQRRGVYGRHGETVKTQRREERETK